jgi:hypothetical protein
MMQAASPPANRLYRPKIEARLIFFYGPLEPQTAEILF